MNWVFSHLLPLLCPAISQLHTHPFPQSLASRFMGTVVCKAVLINRQTQGGWWHKLQIPGPLPRAAIRQAGHRALVWRSPCSPWKLTPSWIVREGTLWTWEPRPLFLPSTACRGRRTWPAGTAFLPGFLFVYLLKKNKSPLFKTTRTAKDLTVVLRDLEGTVAGSRVSITIPLSNIFAISIRGLRSRGLPLTPGRGRGAKSLMPKVCPPRKRESARILSNLLCI